MLIMNFLFQHFILLCNCNTSFIFIECYFIDFKPLLQTTILNLYTVLQNIPFLSVGKKKKKKSQLVKESFLVINETRPKQRKNIQSMLYKRFLQPDSELPTTNF